MEGWIQDPTRRAESCPEGSHGVPERSESAKQIVKGAGLDMGVSPPIGRMGEYPLPQGEGSGGPPEKFWFWECSESASHAALANFGG